MLRYWQSNCVDERRWTSRTLCKRWRRWFLAHLAGGSRRRIPRVGSSDHPCNGRAASLLLHWPRPAFVAHLAAASRRELVALARLGLLRCRHARCPAELRRQDGGV